ncbi:MAG: NAD-dependent epimerase/dehydratase family protein [Candidatus Eisenbacteria bacterium]|nr:NAD-dependent epimerase/dehydratase family protein [Candidatus Eisenbacteria bacterium]
MSGDAALGGREILVTGGAGFVGSHLVRRLVRDGARVTVLTQPGAPIAALAEVAGRVTLVEGDLVESASLEQAIGLLAPEVVFHLAAWTGGRSRPDDPGAWRLSLRVNLEGTLNLLVSLAAGRTRPKRIVRTGGMEEYGAGPAPFREEQREHAVSPYSASQVAATQVAHALAAQWNLPLVTLRPALVYGPGQDESFFLPSLVRACVEGRDFAMTSGEQAVDFVFVDDVVEALIASATRDGVEGEILNAGSGREITLRDLAERVRALSGSRARLLFGARPERAGEASHRWMDSRRAARLLEWSARTKLDEGLRRLIAAARA